MDPLFLGCAPKTSRFKSLLGLCPQKIKIQEPAGVVPQDYSHTQVPYNCSLGSASCHLTLKIMKLKIQF